MLTQLHGYNSGKPYKSPAFMAKTSLRKRSESVREKPVDLH
jgi:hypothetical protein